MPQKESPALYPDCPIRNVLSRISGKWAMLVLHQLDGKQPLRFSELHREMADASPKMLSQALRTLEEDGIVSRKVYPCVPPKVEYKLTERGAELMECFKPLVAWAQSNMGEILKERLQRVNNA